MHNQQRSSLHAIQEKRPKTSFYQGYHSGPKQEQLSPLLQAFKEDPILHRKDLPQIEAAVRAHERTQCGANERLPEDGRRALSDVWGSRWRIGLRNPWSKRESHLDFCSIFEAAGEDIGGFVSKSEEKEEEGTESACHLVRGRARKAQRGRGDDLTNGIHQEPVKKRFK